MNIEIEVGRKFVKEYQKLPERIKGLAKQKEIIFRENIFDPRLNAHKLHGKDKILWAFSIIGKYRIKFVFLTDKKSLFLSIGTHNIYNR